MPNLREGYSPNRGQSLPIFRKSRSNRRFRRDVPAFGLGGTRINLLFVRSPCWWLISHPLPIFRRLPGKISEPTRNLPPSFHYKGKVEENRCGNLGESRVFSQRAGDDGRLPDLWATQRDFAGQFAFQAQ